MALAAFIRRIERVGGRKARTRVFGPELGGQQIISILVDVGSYIA